VAAEIFEAISAGDEERARRLAAADPALGSARNEEGVAAFLVALYHGRADLAEALAPPDADLDLFEAAALGRTERVRELLDGNPELASAYAPDGFHALGLATFFGHPDTAALLVERGADVNAASRNSFAVTALHSACASRQTNTVRLLLERGADPNARQPSGFTPLHAAAEHGDEELARLLLDYGADPSARTEAGVDAAELARSRGHDGVAALIG
jgi:ankyrin repeat protein